MKSIKVLLVMLFMVFGLNTSHAINLDGRYISQSGELMFTFVKDSLYVDMWPSGCGISCFKLIKNKKKSTKSKVLFKAFETYVEDEEPTYREVFIRVLAKGRKLYIEYYGKDKDRKYNTNEKYHITKYKH
jgi:hypothetical protein